MRGALLTISVVLVLAACSSPPRQGTTADEVTRDATGSVAAIADTAGVAESVGMVGDDEVDNVKLPPELADRRIVYFAFDSDELLGDGLAIVAAHARYLASAADLTVRLEGHTDPRGTREYNIGLGERRAQAVRRALALQGVSEVAIQTVSLGEERPASSGEDETSLALNRRVEFIYSRR